MRKLIAGNKFITDRNLREAEDRNPEITREFYHLIGIDRKKCSLTDESSLDHFEDAFGLSTEDRLKLIKDRYQIDLEYSHDWRLVSILSKISK